MHCSARLALVLLSGLVGHGAFCQGQDTLRELSIKLEIRPRAEFRNNHRLLPSDSLVSNFAVSQRNRLEITYQQKAMKVHTSWQEIHVWGNGGAFSAVGSLNAYELYIEPSVGKYFSARIGRQSLSLDNGRLFSAAPWAQQSRAHEGIRLMYNHKVATDLTVAFTRPYSTRFDAAYSPVASHRYKAMLVHHLKYKLTDRYTLTTLNTLDLFENTARHYYARHTNGGRLEYTQNGFYATVAAYYQHGRTADRTPIQAYYLQPEISRTLPRTTIRLGAEILSGECGTDQSQAFHSFVPLYGVAWKFMGNINLFTRFPTDVNGQGLLNPYCFVIYQAQKKLSLRFDAHVFYSQYPLLDAQKRSGKRYLGFENDLSLKYKPAKNIEINYGASYLIASQEMEILNKVPNAEKVPVWSYLMISYYPELFHHKQPR